MNRPQWVRIDSDLFDHPKIERAIQQGGAKAPLLWIQSVCYSTRHLTDGWIPLPLPKRWGYTARQTDALTAAGLWHPLEITDDGGWLIHDYADHQITRAEWEAKTAKARESARKRWAR